MTHTVSTCWSLVGKVSDADIPHTEERILPTSTYDNSSNFCDTHGRNELTFLSHGGNGDWYSAYFLLDNFFGTYLIYGFIGK